MKAIIPTAGVGSRLRPFTHTVPKVLLQVADKPILGHIIDKLIENGVDEVTCVVGYRGDMIKDYVRKKYTNLTTNFITQEKPRGLGHAIHLTANLYKDNSDPLLIILGDTIIDADLSTLKGSSHSMIGVREVADPTRFGVVEMHNGRIKQMIEKPANPTSNLAIVGIYYLTSPSELYSALEENMRMSQETLGEIQLTDALQRMLENGVEMGTFPAEGWHDCGHPSSLLATNESILSQRFCNTADETQQENPTARIKPPVYIDPSATVEDSIVGPNVTIGANVHLRRSIVSNSIINAGAEVENVVLANSIIGNNARVKEASMRLNVGDQSEVVFD